MCSFYFPQGVLETYFIIKKKVIFDEFRGFQMLIDEIYLQITRKLTSL